jgi:hypothetical protein
MCVCFVDLEPWDAQTLCKETQIKIKLLAFHDYILRTHRTNALLLITLICMCLLASTTLKSELIQFMQYLLLESTPCLAHDSNSDWGDFWA